MNPGLNDLKLVACAFGAGLAMLAGNLQAQQVPIPQTAAEVRGPTPGPMTNEYVQMVGRMAYVWGWPLMYVYNQRTELTKAPEQLMLNGAIPLAPMNQVTMLTGYISPAETMYNPEHLFYPNALKRYALGTKNKTLKYNPDGGLTIYLGNKSPGSDKESNWLPAPAGNFSIWLRTYWPDQAILDGTWKPPVVSRAP